MEKLKAKLNAKSEIGERWIYPGLPEAMSKINELIDENTKLREAVMYLIDNLGPNKSEGIYKEIRNGVNKILSP